MLPVSNVSPLVDPPLNLSQKNPFTSLYEACFKGDFEVVKLLINDDSTLLSQCDGEGQTLLYACAVSNELEILAWLDEQNPLALKQVRNDGKTLMHIAAIEGYFELVKWLHSKNPTFIDQVDKNHFTPLHEAAFYEHIPICKLFVENLKANEPLICQIAQRKCPKTLAFLLESGVKSNTSNSFNQTLLHLAAEAGQEQNVRCLLQNGASINAQDQSKRTPLFLAVTQNQLSTVQLLLQNKVNPSLVNEANETVLHAAAFHNHQQLLKELLIYPSCKKLVNAKDKDGKTPLHKAVWGDAKPEIVQPLLANGADVNAENNYGYTPLHWAAKHGHNKSAEYLLEHGAKLNIANTNKDLPFDLAIRHEQDDFLRHFLGLSEKSGREPIPKDIEGHYYKKLLKSKEEGKIEEQILLLQILSYHYVEKKDYITASKILNAALALISKLPEKPCLKMVEQSIFDRLELIEEAFLQSKGISKKLKRSFTEYRVLLNEFREICKKESFQVKQLSLKERLATGNVAISIRENYKIAYIQDRLKNLTTQFKSILEMMIAEIQDVMGKPPVKWACMGMGSMSRDEMCPYSDVEFAFVLENETEKAMNYFRTLSQILELRIINLGETKFPIFGDQYPSPTPDGFCMDNGGNTPLGVTGVYELIGTPKTLAQFQGVEWMDRSIILPNAMSHVCLVAGNKHLISDYNTEKTKVQKLTDKKTKEKNHTLLSFRLLEGHIEEFSPNLTREKEEVRAFGIKKELYRPFQEIIGSLSLFYQLKAKTTFTRIDELVTRGVFSQKGGENLKEAINRVLMLRINAHFFYQNEEEYLCHPENGKSLNPHLMYLNADNLKLLKMIYRILIPFHRSAEEFLKTKDKEAFRKTDFYDENSQDQGIQFTKDLQYAKAQEAYQQAVALNPNDLKALMDLGAIEERMGKSQDAFQEYVKALKIAREKYGENHSEVAKCYDNIGQFFGRFGKYKKELECYQKALKIRLKVLGDHHLLVAESYDNIGNVYLRFGNYEKAIEFYPKALKIRLQIKGDKDLDVAQSYNNIGFFYFILGGYEKAIESFRKALKINLEAKENNDSYIATSYDNIGMVYKSLGDYEKALKYHQQALEIRLQVFGDNHPGITISYDKISNVYKSLGDYGKALEFYQKALKIQQEVFEDNHSGVANHYSNIAEVYDDLEDPEKALEYHQQALKIRLHAFGSNHPDVATSYNGISIAYKKLGNHEKALEDQQQALKIKRQIFGDNHPEIAGSYNNIGNVYFGLLDYKQAIEYFQQALQILRQAFGENHPSVVMVYNNMGEVYYNLEEYEKALEFYQIGLKILRQVLNENHPLVAIIYNNMGEVYNNLGGYEKALECYQTALKIRQEILKDIHPEVATSYHNMGDAYRSLGKFKEAFECLEKALQIRTQVFPKPPPQLGITYLAQANTFYASGCFNEALQYYQKGFEILCNATTKNFSLRLTNLRKIVVMIKQMSPCVDGTFVIKQIYPYFVQLLGIEHSLTNELLNFIPSLAEERLRIGL